MVSKKEAVKILQEQIDEISKLQDRNYKSPEFQLWVRNTRVAIREIFGVDSPNVKEFVDYIKKIP